MANDVYIAKMNFGSDHDRDAYPIAHDQSSVFIRWRRINAFKLLFKCSVNPLSMTIP